MKIYSLFAGGPYFFCLFLLRCLLLLSPFYVFSSPVLFETDTGLFQDRITGMVSDASGPLPGVTVRVKNASFETITDADGRFAIQASAGDTLVFSSLGYAAMEIVANGSVVDAVLSVATLTMQEVTVNAGYYSVKESERTGSIARISSSDIATQPVTNVLAVMQGRMAGVSITQSTGMPGGGYDIKIRGQNSLRSDGSSPLYVIDGVPYASESLTDGYTAAVLGDRPSPLNSIPPEQIESIEVLKDADATAIFGSRGSNGVVLVTTKRAKAGKTQFSADFSRGGSRVTRFMKLLDTPQYLAMRREAFANDGFESYPEYAYDVNGTWDQNRYTDWQKVLIGGTAENSSAQASVSGGSERTSFRLSGAYNEQATVFPGNFKYKTGNVRAAFSHSSQDGRFSLAFSAGLSAQDNSLPLADYTLEAMSLPPNAPALYDGSGALNWENSTFNNPLRSLLGKYRAKVEDLLSNALFKYAISDNLEAQASIGYASTSHRESNTSPSTMYLPSYGIGPEGSLLSLTTAERNSWVAEPQLQWKKAFGRHRLDVLAGGTFQVQRSGQLVQNGYGFSSNALINSLSSASEIFIVADDSREYRYQAFYGRANYIFDDRYILNLTGRRDGSSRFGPGRQFANFFAVGSAWVFSKEKFLAESKVLSFGKLRASYGLTGSDQIGDYQYSDTYSVSGTRYGGQVGLTPTRLFNPDFAWESNRKLEAALELGFLKDRIFLTAAGYRNRSSNQLVGLPLPGTTGFSSIQANLGATVENTGLELTLRTANVEGGRFSWTTSFNISFSRNRLISFPDLEGSSYASRYVVGESLNILKLYRYAGIDPDTGTYVFADTNGDGVVNYLDMTEVRDLNPKFFGGLQNQFRYGNVSLDFLFQFVRQENRDLRQMGFVGGMSNQSDAVVAHWQSPGDQGPGQVYTTGFNSAAVEAGAMMASSDATITDASFIRLKNIALSYRLPTEKTAGVSTEIFLQAQNLFTLTSFKGGDPEFLTGRSLPPLRTIAAGIGFKF